MYHPVTTEVHNLKENITNVVDALINSNKNYIVIFPNNDEGSEIILDAYKKLESNSCFKIYPSIRFEYFLTLLKHCEFMIGNSSAGIRETCVYGIPSIDIGNRQKGRYQINQNSNIIHALDNKEKILDSINNINRFNIIRNFIYGKGKSDEKFIKVLQDELIWSNSFQKNFIDISSIKGIHEITA